MPRRRGGAAGRRAGRGVVPTGSAGGGVSTGSTPTLAARPSTLSASASAGSASGTPSSTEARPFSADFRVSQFASTSSASATSTPANTCGCRCTSLSDDAAGHVVDREPVGLGLGGDAGVEVDLQQQVAELLAQMHVVAGVDGLEGLVALLEQVLRQRAVGLLAVPRAAHPQPVHDRHQVEQPRARHVVRAVEDLDLDARTHRRRSRPRARRAAGRPPRRRRARPRRRPGPRRRARRRRPTAVRRPGGRPPAPRAPAAGPATTRAVATRRRRPATRTTTSARERPAGW